MVIVVIVMAAIVMLVMAFVVSMVFMFAIVVPAIFVAFFTPFLIPLMAAVCSVMRVCFVLSVVVMLPVFAIILVLMLMAFVAPNRIRMDIFMPVHPCALPRRVIDIDDSAGPGNAVVAPAPRPVWSAKHHAEPEADCASNKEARMRTRVHNDRIIIRNHNVVGAGRQDRNIRSATHDDLRAGAQIAIVTR